MTRKSNYVYRHPSFLSGYKPLKRVVVSDTETLLIRPGLQQPPIVCVTVAEREQDTLIYGSPEYRQHLDEILPEDALLVMHNAPFDVWGYRIWMPGAEERLIRAMDEGRVVCTIALQRIIEISTPMTRGPLALDLLAARWGISSQAKADSPRKEFGPYLGCSADEIPAAHRAYAMQDPEVTLRLFERQVEYAERWGIDWRRAAAFVTNRNIYVQRYRNYGQRTDAKVIDTLEERTDREIAKLLEFAQEPIAVNPAEHARIDFLEAELQRTDLKDRERNKLAKELDEFRIVRAHARQAGKQNKKRLQVLVTQAYDGKPPMTEAQKGRTATAPFVPQVSTARDTLLDSGDDLLETFATYGQWCKVRNADLKMLKDGLCWPIHTKYGTADTLRLTSSKPNLQNLTVESGIRDGFTPRPGYAYVEFDHSALEFVCTAQLVYTKLGDDHMLRQVNEGIDSHLLVVKDMKRISYEAAVAAYADPTTKKGFWKYRQTGKVYNYGCLGGMERPESVARYGRKYGVREPRQYWVDGLAAWKRAQPGAQLYLNRYVRRLPKTKDGKYITQIPGVNLQRYGVPFTAAANTGFQGLGTTIEALCMAWFEQAMNDPSNPLWGCHVVSQVHDSFVLEVPLDRVTAAFYEAHYIMTEAPKLFMPDVKLGAEGVATMKVTKGAELRVDSDGEVLVWVEPGKWLKGTTGQVLDFSGGRG